MRLRTLGSLTLAASLLISSSIAGERLLSTPIGELEIAETTFGEAIQYLRDRSVELDPAKQGVNILIGPGVDTTRSVSLYLADASIGSALICLIDLADFDYRREQHALVVSAAGQGELAKKRKKASLSSAPSVHAIRAQNQIFESIEFNASPLGDVLQFISEKSQKDNPGNGINIVRNHRVDPDLSITLTLRRVPASSVLDYVTRLAGLETRVEPWAIFVEPAKTESSPLGQAR